MAVITWYDVPVNIREYKVFHITEEELYIDWFLQTVRSEMTNTYYEVIDTEISIEEVTKKVIRRECGAVTTFIGTVREFTKGRRTLYLEYVAYKTMAEKMLKIGLEVKKWPGTLRLHIASVRYKFLI